MLVDIMMEKPNVMAGEEEFDYVSGLQKRLKDANDKTRGYLQQGIVRQKRCKDNKKPYKSGELV